MLRKLLLLLVIVSASGYAAPRDYGMWSEILPSIPEHIHHRTTLVSLDDDSLHRFDVIKFECHLGFDLNNTTLSGYTLTELSAHEIPLQRIDFRFNNSFTIDSIWAVEGYVTTLDYRANDSIVIGLNQVLPLNSSIHLGIAYHGIPDPIDQWGGFHWIPQSGWRPQTAYSMGDGLDLEPPPSNYAWFPCHSDPNDKVLWEAWMKVPSNRVVCTNGIRLDTVNNGDGTTIWHYRLNQPVSTYLISVAVGDYVIMNQRESNPLIENFVYPSRTTQAQTHFAHIPAVLDSFQRWFGPYPFERFGNTMTTIGDMEHATCVSHTDQTVVNNNSYDWLLFHEMSHQWWGDWVTCGDWRDLWLNEGFGTYCEALGLEAVSGHQAYSNYVVSDLFQAALNANDSYSIYDPDYYWGSTVYEKGACVMHMLRELMGDSLFFLSLREYGQEHAFGNAVTADWQAKLEQHYGESLDWFFQPWVYGTKYPRYHVTLDLGDIAGLMIEQTQTTNTLFRMPIDVRVICTNGDTSEFTLWNRAIRQESWMIPNDSMQISGWPASVEIDPYNKILKRVTYSVLGTDEKPNSIPKEFAISSVYPNPFNPTTTISFSLPKSTITGLRVFTITGREVSFENLGQLTAGNHQFSWDGSRFASGIYLFRIETPLDNRITKAILLK